MMIVNAQSQKLGIKKLVSIFSQVQINIINAVVAPVIALLQVGSK